jgi:hypothetical protein
MNWEDTHCVGRMLAGERDDRDDIGATVANPVEVVEPASLLTW